MKFINEAAQKKCVVVWCGKWCPPQYMEIEQGIKSLNNPELQKMSKALAEWIKTTETATPDDFTKATQAIAQKNGWECVWNYTQSIDTAPKEMQTIGECDFSETERVDGDTHDAECFQMEEDYRAGDIEDFIGSKASNRRAKVVIKESGKYRPLNDIYFENNNCVIDIG